MTKLTQKERESFDEIMKQDLESIQQAFGEQIQKFWAMARTEVEKREGFHDLRDEKERLKKQMAEAQQRIHSIERELGSEDLQVEQIVALGGKADSYGRFSGAHFYGIPIKSQFDYKVMEYIKENINLEVPAKFLHDLGRACIRELAMSGTFDEAREAYEKFYSLDFRKYGVDIPPRLSEVKDDVKLLEGLEHSKQTLSLPASSAGVAPEIDGRESYIG